MAFVQFDDVSFFYPRVDPDEEESSLSAIKLPNAITPVFQHLSVEAPSGVVSLVGQNGIGKTTFLLLAGARLFPASGSVTIDGRASEDFRGAAEDPAVEAERNSLVSFVYQNMEFETEEPVGTLMETILENGNLSSTSDGLMKDVCSALELDGFLSKRLQELSKGQMQRAIIGFSVLYGSKFIIMDEPVFALEEPQKDRTFEFLLDYAGRYGASIYYSAHNLELTKKYSEYLLLFYKEGGIEIGPTSEIFTRDRLEEAYQVPMDALYRRDSLYRDMLVSLSAKRGRA